MRFYEFINEDELLQEGGKSDGTRYNTEIGLMVGFLGLPAEGFDPYNPEIAFEPVADFIADPDKFYKEVKKFLAPNFDPAVFTSWVGKGQAYITIIQNKLASSGDTVPDKLGWSGGSNINEEGAADVIFFGSENQGASVKAETGITLKNLTPKAIGLETERGEDVFSKYALPEYIDMKQQIFTDVLNIAMSQPDQLFAPKQPKYGITYNSATDDFTLAFKGTTKKMNAQQIMSQIDRNATWQRVFGDWFVANWQTKKSYAQPLFNKLALVFEQQIETTLQDSKSLQKVLAMSKRSYFYTSANHLYYVPSVSEASDLRVKGVRYGEPDGTSQKFIVMVGREDSEESAKILVYIRYANGMFEANPTVRVQELRDPEFISWEKLV